MAKRKPRPAPKGRWTAREVVELAVEHDLAEIEIEQGGVRIRVVRERPPIAAAGLVPRPETSTLPQPQPVAAQPSETVTIEAPMVGTFYRASSPDAVPFVSEGDVIKEGQVLCIIEAMKLMNEIEAKVAGRIVKVLVENAQPVEYGQPLFLLEPRR